MHEAERATQKSKSVDKFRFGADTVGTDEEHPNVAVRVFFLCIAVGLGAMVAQDLHVKNDASR